MKDTIEQQKLKYTQVHEQEAKEIADAAQQMVKTLNELLDSKNEQLRNKEAQIEAMRLQMQQQSEHDALEIAKLRQ